jgi:hypothetical protein
MVSCGAALPTHRDFGGRCECVGIDAVSELSRETEEGEERDGLACAYSMARSALSVLEFSRHGCCFRLGLVAVQYQIELKTRKGPDDYLSKMSENGSRNLVDSSLQ